MNTSHLSLAKLHRSVSRAGKIILSEAAVNPGRRHMFIPQDFITGPDISLVCSIKHVTGFVKDCLRQNFYRNFSAERFEFSVKLQVLDRSRLILFGAFREICKLPEVLSLRDNLQALVRGTPPSIPRSCSRFLCFLQTF